MSNTNTFNDFYQVPDLKFDINKLRAIAIAITLATAIRITMT